jgi:two-component system sensor histidine kinase/response regulator
MGDEGRLRQVLINLLGNAVKFTDQGGIALRARWSNGTAEFEVEDTGQGMNEGELGHLFQAFVQTQSGRAATEGTGLGLAISRNFVRLMGGDITVKSEPGHGSTFRVVVPLPVAAEGARPKEPPRVVRVAPGQNHFRILAVDDKWENRLLLVRILTSVGFEVREAADGKEAYDVWREWHPHLVWMDIRMPILNGYEATKKIRDEEERRARIDRRENTASLVEFGAVSTDALESRLISHGFPRTVVIALSASAFEQDRMSIRECGCDDFVAKPFREATIFEKLHEYLGVEFEYEVVDQIAVREESCETAEFAALPRDLLASLNASVAGGDVDGAMRSIDGIAQVDKALASELKKMVKTYDFDALQELLDTVLRIR